MTNIPYKFKYFDDTLTFEKNLNPNLHGYPQRGATISNASIMKNIKVIFDKLNMKTHSHPEMHTNIVICMSQSETVITASESISIDVRLHRLLYATFLACKMKAQMLSSNKTLIYPNDTQRVPENPDFEILKAIDKIENRLYMEGNAAHEN